MSDLWEHSDEVRCTHPGWPTLKGWGSVSGSFFNLFQAGAGLQFLLSDTDVRIEGDIGLVFCVENILGAGTGPSVSSLNVFHRGGEGAPWKLIVHQASLVSAIFG